MSTCAACGQPQAEGHECVVALLNAVGLILHNVGDEGKCRGCQARIFWVTHKNGKKVPYTGAGLNHFVDCPAAEQFKKGGSK